MSIRSGCVRLLRSGYKFIDRVLLPLSHSLNLAIDQALCLHVLPVVKEHRKKTGESSSLSPFLFSFVPSVVPALLRRSTVVRRGEDKPTGKCGNLQMGVAKNVVVAGVFDDADGGRPLVNATGFITASN